MANFVQEKYNSMPEQVEENKKNIKELINYIKPVYKSLIALTIATTSIAIASTNAPDETTSGWIIDENGLLFHITSGDGTNLLINYYATLKGEKGDTGETGATGADGQDGARGYSIHYASVDFDENTTTYNLSDISQNAPVVADDLVLFKNGYLVLIYSVSATTITTANGTAILLEIGGSHKVIKVYKGVIHQSSVLDDVYYIEQSDIEDNVVDFATGQPPTSYEQGDVILEVGWNDEYDYIENLYIFNDSISDGTVAPSGALLLSNYHYINNGGKGVPTITIDVSQMTSQTTALLTDDQISILNDNGFVAINRNGVNAYLIQVVNNANAMMFCISFNDINNNEYMSFRSILVIKSTKIATFYTQNINNVEYDSQNHELKVGNVANIPLGKQLYNYAINYRNVNNNQLLSIQFISSENFNSINDFYTYLENNGFSSTSNLFYFNGGHYNGNPCYCVYNDGNLHFGYCSNGASSITYILLPLTSMTLTKQNI